MIFLLKMGWSGLSEILEKYSLIRICFLFIKDMRLYRIRRRTLFEFEIINTFLKNNVCILKWNNKEIENNIKF